MKKVKILWTGGFDSSFRVTQLSRCDVEIEPYYLSDGRLSEEYELNAMAEITEYLEGLNETKAKFLPMVYLTLDELKKDDEITDALSKVLENDYLGGQYRYLGTFSKMYPGMELSVHKDDKAIMVIEKYGALSKVHDETIGEYYVLDESKSPDYLIELFKNYHFPLVDYTKKQMRKDYKDHGLKKVISKTWFCHKPIRGKPCGYCNSCMYTIEEGLYERFGILALIRFSLRKMGVYSLPKRYRKWKLNAKRLSYFIKRDSKKYLRYMRRDLGKYSKVGFKKSLKLLGKDIVKYPKMIKKDIKSYIEFFKTH